MPSAPNARRSHVVALAVVLSVVVLLLAVLVAGLLRSHADILKALHDLGVGVGDPGADGHDHVDHVHDHHHGRDHDRSDGGDRAIAAAGRPVGGHSPWGRHCPASETRRRRRPWPG